MEPSISFKTLLIVIGIFTTAFAGILGVCTTLLGFALKGWIFSVKTEFTKTVIALKELLEQHEKYEKEEKEQQNIINVNLFERVNILETRKFNDPDLTNKRCLIVDDEIEKAELVQLYFDKLGIKSKVCTSIDKAKHLIKDAYDFLVLDWFHPKNRTAEEIVSVCINNSLYIKGNGRGYPKYRILMYSGQPQNPVKVRGVEFIDFPFGESEQQKIINLKTKIGSFFTNDRTN